MSPLFTARPDHRSTPRHCTPRNLLSALEVRPLQIISQQSEAFLDGTTSHHQSSVLDGMAPHVASHHDSTTDQSPLGGRFRTAQANSPHDTAALAVNPVHGTSLRSQF